LDGGAGSEWQHEAATQAVIHAFCLPLVLRDPFGTIFTRSWILNPESAQLAGQVRAKRSLINLGSIQQGDTPFKRIPRGSKLNADLSRPVRRQEGGDVSIVGMTPKAQTVGKHEAKTTFEVYRLLDVGQCTDTIP
jgi:hypothetical protein